MDKMNSKETYNSFEILATPRTLNENLASIYTEEDESANVLRIEGRSGSDIIIHIFDGEDGPEEYLHIKSGVVVATRPFMYTNRYFKCRPGKNGQLKAII